MQIFFTQILRFLLTLDMTPMKRSNPLLIFFYVLSYQKIIFRILKTLHLLF